MQSAFLFLYQELSVNFFGSAFIFLIKPIDTVGK